MVKVSYGATAMPAHRDRLPEFDIDTEGRGISGFYDGMMGGVGVLTPQLIWLVAGWLWALNWPAPAAFIQIGPVLTLGLILKLALGVLTLRAVWDVFRAFSFADAWLKLEKLKLHTVVRNDHVFRVTYYRRSDHTIRWDGKTQDQRVDEEINMSRYYVNLLFQESIELGIVVLAILLVPLTFWLTPMLMGPEATAAVARWWHGLSVDQLAAQARDNWPSLSNCLRWSDVRHLLSHMSPGGVIIWLWVLFKVVPKLTQLGWTIFDARMHAIGCQYIPGAKVLDAVVATKTLETLRAERVHGGADFVDPFDGAASMSR